MQRFMNTSLFRDLMKLIFDSEEVRYTDRNRSVSPLDDWAMLARPQPLHYALGSTRHLSGDVMSRTKSLRPHFSHHFFEMLDEGPAMLIAGNEGNIGPCADWLAGAGMPARRCRSLGEAAIAIGHTEARISLLVIDIDSLGGISAAINGMLTIRDTHPAIPLILLSADIPASDHSTERLRLCDVTLRAPVSYAALELAIVEAARNNIVWCSRDDD